MRGRWWGHSAREGSNAEDRSAYALVFDEGTHRSVGKESGKIAPMELWNNALRQRVDRYDSL
jgi:hypothetical protein